MEMEQYIGQRAVKVIIYISIKYQDALSVFYSCVHKKIQAVSIKMYEDAGQVKKTKLGYTLKWSVDFCWGDDDWRVPTILITDHLISEYQGKANVALPAEGHVHSDGEVPSVLSLFGLNVLRSDQRPN